MPENDAKWGVVAPAPETTSYEAFDALIAFARADGMEVHGHCLVWPGHDPAWITERLGGGWAAALEGHVAAEVGRYRGRVASWDVVNEAVEPADGRPDGLRACAWLEAAGPAYVPAAFAAARRAAPGTRLAYNDYGVEYATRKHAAKRRAVLALLEGLRRRGLVDAFGMQSHLWLGVPFEPATLRRFLGEVADLGLEIWISELDVDDRAASGPAAARDLAVAAHVYEFLSATLDEAAVRRVVTWGLSTRYSWLNATPDLMRSDGLETRGLPFDSRFRPTAMGRALGAAFTQAPER